MVVRLMARHSSDKEFEVVSYIVLPARCILNVADAASTQSVLDRLGSLTCFSLEHITMLRVLAPHQLSPLLATRCPPTYQAASAPTCPPTALVALVSPGNHPYPPPNSARAHLPAHSQSAR